MTPEQAREISELRKRFADLKDARVKAEQERDAFKGNADDAYAKWVAERARADALQARVAKMHGTLVLAYGAMNHLGDVLNGMDATLERDVQATTAAFDAVRAALADTGGEG